MNRDDRSEIFTVRARRCKRCGGLLTSSRAIEDGYGHSCKMKLEIEAANRRMMKDQISLFSDSDEICNETALNP